MPESINRQITIKAINDLRLIWTTPFGQGGLFSSVVLIITTIFADYNHVKKIFCFCQVILLGPL